jgi:hypothetical protein
MGRKTAYSQEEWDAFAKGEALAENRRPCRTPLGLSAYEQSAFREGYSTRCEDIKNRPVVDEIKKMLSPLPIKKLFQSLAHHH